jgi:hypothetical protein
VDTGDERVGWYGVVAKVRTHSEVAGSRQFSQTPAMPKGERSFMAMAKGCFTLERPSTPRTRPRVRH